MAVTVTLDRMVHAKAIHQSIGKEIGLEGDCASSGHEREVNPLDLLVMSVASCLVIYMAKSAKTRDIDLTGTWADAKCELKDYVVRSIHVSVYSPFRPSPDERKFLEEESHHCPVYLAIKDGAEVSVTYEWGSCAKPKTQEPASACQAQKKACEA